MDLPLSPQGCADRDRKELRPDLWAGGGALRLAGRYVRAATSDMKNSKYLHIYIYDGFARVGSNVAGRVG